MGWAGNNNAIFSVWSLLRIRFEISHLGRQGCDIPGVPIGQIESITGHSCCLDPVSTLACVPASDWSSSLCPGLWLVQPRTRPQRHDTVTLLTPAQALAATNDQPRKSISEEMFDSWAQFYAGWRVGGWLLQLHPEQPLGVWTRGQCLQQTAASWTNWGSVHQPVSVQILKLGQGSVAVLLTSLAALQRSLAEIVKC